MFVVSKQLTLRLGFLVFFSKSLRKEVTVIVKSFFLTFGRISTVGPSLPCQESKGTGKCGYGKVRSQKCSFSGDL